MECLGDGSNLGEDIDAVFIFVDHAGDAANLPFDAAQTFEVRLFVGGVTVLGFGRLAATACAGLHLGRSAGYVADLGGCAVATLVAGGFHDSSVYPMGVSCKGAEKVLVSAVRREAGCLPRNHHNGDLPTNMWLLAV